LVELLECKNNKKLIFVGFLCCHLPSGSWVNVGLGCEDGSK
jgi:hypothetical protein